MNNVSLVNCVTRRPYTALKLPLNIIQHKTGLLSNACQCKGHFPGSHSHSNTNVYALYMHHNYISKATCSNISIIQCNTTIYTPWSYLKSGFTGQTMILKSAEDSANYRALFQSLIKSMFCNCIYDSYNVNVNFINDEFINEFGHLKYKMFGGCIQIHALC